MAVPPPDASTTTAAADAELARPIVPFPDPSGAADAVRPDLDRPVVPVDPAPFDAVFATAALRSAGCALELTRRARPERRDCVPPPPPPSVELLAMLEMLVDDAARLGVDAGAVLQTTLAASTSAGPRSA